MKRILWLILAIVVSLPLTLPAVITHGQAPGKFRRVSNPIPNQYVVVFSNSAVSAAAVDATVNNLLSLHGGTVKHIYRAALRGFAVQMPEAVATTLSNDPQVEYVIEDGTVTAFGVNTQSPRLLGDWIALTSGTYRSTTHTTTATPARG